MNNNISAVKFDLGVSPDISDMTHWHWDNRKAISFLSVDLRMFLPCRVSDLVLKENKLHIEGEGPVYSQICVMAQNLKKSDIPHKFVDFLNKTIEQSMKENEVEVLENDNNGTFIVGHRYNNLPIAKIFEKFQAIVYQKLLFETKAWPIKAPELTIPTIVKKLDIKTDLDPNKVKQKVIKYEKCKLKYLIRVFNQGFRDPKNIFYKFSSDMIKNIILLCGNSMSAADVSEVFSKYFCKPLIEPRDCGSSSKKTWIKF